MNIVYLESLDPKAFGYLLPRLNKMKLNGDTVIRGVAVVKVAMNDDLEIIKVIDCAPSSVRHD